MKRLRTSPSPQNAGFFRRLTALTRKEILQLKRDRSSILMGVVLPIVLILIVGYGLSLDIKHVPMAVALEDSSPTARRLVSFTEQSEYFSPRYVYSIQEAKDLMRSHQVSVVLRVPQDFSRELSRGEAKLQLLINGVESTAAASAQSYVQGAVLGWAAEQQVRTRSQGYASIVSRVWFNDANTSTWFFVPGILMVVLTICGVFLTSVVMAREWERGTLESLFVTPMGVLELILAKVIPYFCLSFIGMASCLAVSRIFYDLPLRGSLVILLGVSMLYILVALGLGIVISAVTKNQFLACQVSMLVSFLPSVMLSGFIFDLHSEPMLIRLVSRFFPATYYLQLLRSLCLTGNYWPLIGQNSLILGGYMILFIGLAFRLTRKRVA